MLICLMYKCALPQYQLKSIQVHIILQEQIYPLRFNAPTDDEDQAKQVKAFLEREREIIAQVLKTVS